MEITVDDLAVEESFSKDLILLFQECENEIPHPPSVPRKLASLIEARGIELQEIYSSNSTQNNIWGS